MSDWNRPYPDALPIEPLARPPVVTVQVPGSKSITNRALPLAALAAGPKGCSLRGVLRSEDTEVMITALRALGFTVEADELLPGWVSVERPVGGSPIPSTEADL